MSENSQSKSALLGRNVDQLSLAERLEYANQWVARRQYKPTKEKSGEEGAEYVDVRIQNVEAAGSSSAECIAQLRSRNLDPAEFEFTILKPPY